MTRSVLELTGDDGYGPSSAVLALPKDTPGEVAMEILDALRHAYQAGHEDRSAELIPGDGPADRLRSIVQGEVLGAIDQWGPGYASYASLGEDEEYYIALEGRDQASGVLVMGIHSNRHGEDRTRFRVRVLVERIEQR
jgi:hypothetical protein